MNRERISKALSQIEDRYIAESMSYRPSGRAHAPERKPKMGKYEQNQTTKRGTSVRKLTALILAACLVFALAITAYAANLWGIREMFNTPNRQLPQEAEDYIVPQTQPSESAAQASDWSAHVTESLYDGSRLMVTVAISGGDQYILASDYAMPGETESVIGLSGEQTLEAYAASQGKKLLMIGATMRGSEGLEIPVESYLAKSTSDREMTILVDADMVTASGSVSQGVCRVYAVEAETGEKIKELSLPVQLTQTPVSEADIFVPDDPDAIPGVRMGEATVSKSPLGYSIQFMETETVKDARYDLMKYEFEEVEYSAGGSVLMDDGNYYFQTSMAQGTVTDTLTLHVYDWDKQLLGTVVFRKQP